MTEQIDGLGAGDPERGPAGTGPASADRADAPVDCSEALTKLFEFLDAEISEVDGDRIRQHLADCEPCLGEYDFEDHLKKVVRRSCHEAAPVELHERIRQQLSILQSTVVLRAGSVLSPEGPPTAGDPR